MITRLTADQLFEQTFGIHPDRVQELDTPAKESLLERVVASWLSSNGPVSRRTKEIGRRIQIGKNQKDVDSMLLQNRARERMKDPSLGHLQITARRKLVAAELGITIKKLLRYCPTKEPRGRPKKVD